VNADLIMLLKGQCVVTNESDGCDFNCQNFNINPNIFKAYLIIFLVAQPFYGKYVLVLLWLMNVDLIILRK